MEFFAKTMAVKLRSHLDKYLVAHDDQETVRQSRNGSSRKTRWFVELVEGREDVIRLKSCDGRYLMASDTPFLLGMTGKKVLQTEPEELTELNIQWEPVRDGFQVRLKSWCGKFLRANGGMAPWRNSVTHDEPHTGATQKWILWDVEAVEANPDSLTEYLSSMSSFSSVVDDVLEAASDGFLEPEPGSPLSASVADEVSFDPGYIRTVMLGGYLEPEQELPGLFEKVPPGNLEPESPKKGRTCLFCCFGVKRKQ